MNGIKRYSLVAVTSIAIALLATPPANAARSRDAGVLLPARALPMRFEANQGQTEPSVKFVARGRRSTLFLTSSAAVLSLSRVPASRIPSPVELAAKDGTPPVARRDVIAMRLVGGCDDARPVGMERLPGTTSYIRGGAAARRLTGIASYARVVYAGVYPGVDLVYYGKDNDLEYDFVVAPGGDPRHIGVRFDGVLRLGLEGGDLVLDTEGGRVRHRRPVVYQIVDGNPRTVAGRYVLRGPFEFGFEVGAYDPTLPLVIDPVVTLEYSTYLGGNLVDAATSVAVDATGAAYITGETESLDFPTAGAHQGDHGGGDRDAFVAKLSPDGSSLLYATYFGGSGYDIGWGIAVDATGAATVAGITRSRDFPTATPLQGVAHGLNDAFVARFTPDGTGLLYSTYLGGSGEDHCFAMTQDAAGAVYVAGWAGSADFPTANAFQPQHGGGSYDAFVSKIDGSGRALVFSTFLGSTNSEGCYGVAVDPSGAVCIAGATGAGAAFPIANPVQSGYRGGVDGFVTRLTPDGSALAFSTFLGGTSYDFCRAVAAGQDGRVYLTGSTASPDFPTVGAFDGSFNGGSGNDAYRGDAYLTILPPTGGRIAYSSFLGGASDDTGYSVTVDVLGAVYVMGQTYSSDLPIANAFQPVYGGSGDTFVMKLDLTENALVYSSFLGGSGFEILIGSSSIVVDFSGNAYVAGKTYSRDFPTTEGCFQPTFNGGEVDGFAAKIVDVFDVTWAAPDASLGRGAPPRFLTAVRSGAGKAPAVELLASKADNRTETSDASKNQAAPGDVTCYTLYRKPTQDAPRSIWEIFGTFPPQQTSAHGVPGGAFFVITACYADGSESGESNTVSGGDGEAQLQTVVVKGKRITATGTRFTDAVTVSIDGVPFARSAVVAGDASGVRTVTQTGTLADGRTIKSILRKRDRFLVEFRNSTGGVAAVEVVR